MKCLVIMPFDPAFDTVHQIIKRCIAEAKPDQQMASLRLDEVLVAGKITIQMVEELRTADLYIADVTGPNPNVMWEVGFAAAMERPVIAISQSTEALPFDIHDLRVLRYDPKRLETSLYPFLIEAIRQTMAAPAQTREPSTQLPTGGARTIAVSGSSYVLPARAAAGVPVLLTPYLSQDVVWYCGTRGACDEAAAEFLLAKRQRLIPVAMNPQHISPGMVDILKRHQLQFVNAERERFPAVTQGMTNRDALFIARSDLLVLLWDGKSPHIRQMADWARTQGKNHIIGFV